MANFFIMSNTAGGQTLLDLESGMIAAGATLYGASGTVVSFAGDNARLIVMGDLVGAMGDRVIGTSGGARADAVITVGAAGSIVGSNSPAISFTFSNTFNLSNAGLISGWQPIILIGSDGTETARINNTGTIISQGDGGFGAIGTFSSVAHLIVNNTGTIQSDSEDGTIRHLASIGSLTVRNSGLLAGPEVSISTNEALSLVNSGTLRGDVRYSDEAFIENAGLIFGSVVDDFLTNTRDTTLHNFGTITGNVIFGAGNDTFVNAGCAVGGRVRGGDGDDTYRVDRADIRIVDSAGSADVVYTTVDLKMPTGIEQLFADTDLGLVLSGRARNDAITGNTGDDTLHGAQGNDTLDGMDGDDVIHGGGGNDDLRDGSGDDQLFGGNGDDRLVSQGGNDTFDGGAGRDELVIAETGNSAAVVNLPAGTLVTVSVDTGAIITTAVLVGIEDVRSLTFGDDTITGSVAANRLDGGVGDDVILGQGGNDTLIGFVGDDTLRGGNGNDLVDGGAGDDALFGDNGNDTLIGGDGRDTMNGGAGNDTFVFEAITDSPAGLPDLIFGYTETSGIIDLSLIDADNRTAGDQAFLFIGTDAFSGSVGQVRYFQDAGLGQTILQVRRSNSATAEMEIAIDGLVTPVEAGFIL